MLRNVRYISPPFSFKSTLRNNLQLEASLFKHRLGLSIDHRITYFLLPVYVGLKW